MKDGMSTEGSLDGEIGLGEEMARASCRYHGVALCGGVSGDEVRDLTVPYYL